jgi:hypothetical protein
VESRGLLLLFAFFRAQEFHKNIVG